VHQIDGAAREPSIGALQEGDASKAPRLRQLAERGRQVDEDDFLLVLEAELRRERRAGIAGVAARLDACTIMLPPLSPQ